MVAGWTGLEPLTARDAKSLMAHDFWREGVRFEQFARDAHYARAYGNLQLSTCGTMYKAPDSASFDVEYLLNQ